MAKSHSTIGDRPTHCQLGFSLLCVTKESENYDKKNNPPVRVNCFRGRKLQGEFPGSGAVCHLEVDD